MDDDFAALDAISTFEHLRDSYLLYYDTPFGVANESLMAERRELLNKDGGLFREPLLELRPQYVTSQRNLTESSSLAGLSSSEAEFFARGLVPEGLRLYTHQESALISALVDKKNLVLTPGTGSGKTESFLLPVIGQLLAESRQWSPKLGGHGRWWETSSNPYKPVRPGIEGRRAAVRAMILYPMNALVDDQLVRLRRALDSSEAHAWLDQNRSGHRFYFGRYTGATPVTGGQEKPEQVDLLRRLMKDANALQESASAFDDERRYFLPRLDGGEMFSRWDMISSPPDILITNYSMLNVMLLRENEESFFSQTRTWMAESPDNVFTLVLDEMHSYRGTAGTEVALLIRNLKRRLGLDKQPEKLRVIAASASLTPERDAKYLSDFFALPESSFVFLSGEIQKPESKIEDISLRVEDVLGGGKVPEAAVALENAFRDYTPDSGKSELSVRTVDELAHRLFGKAEHAVAKQATRLVLEAASQGAHGLAWPKLRAHLFFRNVAGMWACSDPECSAVPAQRKQPANIGRLYDVPTPRCECGARVLELLYCQSCGDVLLGGYAVAGTTQNKALNVSLLADVPEISKLPDQASSERTANNYLVYWPKLDRPELSEKPKKTDKNSVTYQFMPVQFNAHSGGMKGTDDAHTGWVFRALASKPKERTADSILPFPISCPACGDDWRIQHDGKKQLKPTDPRTMRSPVRTMRTGFEKVNQVLITELMRRFEDEKRKCVVFADSRQDAAKLASGIALNHYQDTVRSLIVSAFQGPSDLPDGLAEARAFITGTDQSQTNKAAAASLMASHPQLMQQLQPIWLGYGTGDEDDVLAKLRGPLSVKALATKVRSEFLKRGMNPGGPGADLQSKEEEDQPDPEQRWTKAYDWSAETPTVRPDLSPSLELLFGQIELELIRNVEESLVSGSGRDFESIGLGWLSTRSGAISDIEPLSIDSVAQSSLRILAEKKRFFGLRRQADQPPSVLRRYWGRAGELLKMEVEEVRDKVLAAWGPAVKTYLIDPALVYLREAEEKAYLCTKCTRAHQFRGIGICTKCCAPLHETPVLVAVSADYYAARASADNSAFRLNCAELTGQTDRSDAQLRQARFQKVFLGERDIPLADEVDLLSVTTTMEAGVDIGALDAVVMGNMPPTRFNYQQRVGRAGRRQSAVAIALTVCRPRSHDEHYFANPREITSAPTPKPYLALGSAVIAQRALASEFLRMAFLALKADSKNAKQDWTSNTHGRFGLASDWPKYEPDVHRWWQENEDELAQASAAVLDSTPFAETSAEFALATREWLIDELTQTSEDPSGHEEMSQRLAERGVLPMFGFPSKVKNLYLRPPKSRFPWPPTATISRDGSLAVSSFAPGSELIKDGWIYRAQGVVSYKPSYPYPVLEPKPFGMPRILQVCRRCSYLRQLGAFPEVELPCPQCSAEPGVAKTLDMRQPMGYWAKRDRPFDGNFAWTSQAMPVRAMVDLEELRPSSWKSLLIHQGRAKKYVINDNGGRHFNFRSVNDNDSKYVAVSAGIGDRAEEDDEQSSLSVAIGLVEPTDFLFVGPSKPKMDSGWRLDLTSGAQQIGGSIDRLEGRRAAWYSYAFLLRKLAAAHLDVQPQELIAGLYSTVEEDHARTYAFIADDLENGAGFASYLGSTENFVALMALMDETLAKFQLPDHASECRGSCYRCLRDYQNMAFHPLLDWRLGMDVHSLLKGDDIDLDFDHQRRLLLHWCAAHKGEVIETAVGNAVVYNHPIRGEFLVIPHHPLEGVADDCVSERVCEISVNLADQFPEHKQLFVDEFSLDRTPTVVLEMMDAAGGS